MCFTTKYEKPYVRSHDTVLKLDYDLCVKPNAKEIHQYGIGAYLGKPSGIPDQRMMTHPVWSSWAQYKVDINTSVILQFANDIRANGFKDSQLEIDDEWESCYGEAVFNTDPDKFPDPAQLISDLNDLGFRTTIWIHPFVSDFIHTYKYIYIYNI